MSRHTFVGSLALLLSLSGCHHQPKLGSSDLKDLQQLAAFFERPGGPTDPSQFGALLSNGLAELDLGRSGACKKALAGTSAADPARRAMSLSNAFEPCQIRCPTDTRAVAMAESRDQMALIVKQCDAAGPDPVFGGALAPRRLKAEPIHYILLRHQLTEVKLALEKADTAEAKALWARFEALLPRAMDALEAWEQESHPATRGQAHP